MSAPATWILSLLASGAVGDVVTLCATLIAGYGVGARVTTRRAEAAASKALMITRTPGREPTLASVIQLIEALGDAANVDPVTGLSTRSRTVLEASAAIAVAQSQMSWMGLIVVDLDHFKQVNDTFGHDAGDRVLSEMGRRVKAVIRDRGSVGRFGGEEFMIVLPRHDVTMTAGVTEEVLQRLREDPVDYDGTLIAVTGSAGVIATYGDHCDFGTMVRVADEAMYAAKAAGRDRFLVRSIERISASEAPRG